MAAMAEAPAVLPVVIKNPHNNLDYKVEVPCGWSVGQLKEKLHREYDGNPDPSHQKLIYCGKVLLNGGTIGEIVSKARFGAPEATNVFHLVLKEDGSPSPHRSSSFVSDASPRPTRTSSGDSVSASPVASPGPRTLEPSSPDPESSAPATPPPASAAASPDPRAPVAEAPSTPPPSTPSPSPSPAPDAAASPSTPQAGYQAAPHFAGHMPFFPGAMPVHPAAAPAACYMAAYNAALAALSPGATPAPASPFSPASPLTPHSPFMFSPYMPPPMPYYPYAMPYAAHHHPGAAHMHHPHYPGAPPGGAAVAAPHANNSPEPAAAAPAADNAGVGGGAAGAERVQVVRIDLKLIVKLAMLVFVLNQDGSRPRLMLLSGLAFLVYLHQTGALAPVTRWLSRRLAPAAVVPMRPRPGGGGDPMAVAPPTGVVAEVQTLVVGFVTSLFPGWSLPEAPGLDAGMGELNAEPVAAGGAHDHQD